MRFLGAINPGYVEQMAGMKRSRPPGVGFITGCDPYTGCLTLEHFFFAKTVGGCAAEPIVGRETILNYPTEAIRQRWTEHGRMTVWMAPGLGCFALNSYRLEAGRIGCD